MNTSHILLQAVKQETIGRKYENIERVDVRFRQLSNLKCSCIEANSNFSSVFKNTELSNQAYDPGGGGGVSPNMGCTGMCGPKG